MPVGPTKVKACKSTKNDEKCNMDNYYSNGIQINKPDHPDQGVNTKSPTEQKLPYVHLITKKLVLLKSISN